MLYVTESTELFLFALEKLKVAERWEREGVPSRFKLTVPGAVTTLQVPARPVTVEANKEEPNHMPIIK